MLHFNVGAMFFLRGFSIDENDVKSVCPDV